MKKTTLLIAALYTALSLNAQVWTDAGDLPLYGKASKETVTRYSRMPAELQQESRPAVWHLGQNSAGLYIRFRTSSPNIWARWVSSSKYTMNHMSPTGSRGLDLYTMVDGKWRFIAAGRPNLKNTLTEQMILSDMEPQMREYMLYLSLYNGIDKLEIGTEEGHPVMPGETASPKTGRPIVMYGTSITQGGCVSRPGMLYTSIMSRALDREFINLGFSGNAKLDLDIARLMASVPDPALYIIACTENASEEEFKERGEEFFRILRNAHPEVPVLFVQSVRYADMLYNKTRKASVQGRMKDCRELYEKLRKSGEKHVYFADPAGTGTFADAEGSVDGCHLTDLGAMRFAEELLPVIKKALRK